MRVRKVNGHHDSNLPLLMSLLWHILNTDGEAMGTWSRGRSIPTVLTGSQGRIPPQCTTVSSAASANSLSVHHMPYLIRAPTAGRFSHMVAFRAAGMKVSTRVALPHRAVLFVPFCSFLKFFLYTEFTVPKVVTTATTTSYSPKQLTHTSRFLPHLS